MVYALTGFMGSGKSSVGRELAALLSSDFIDLDDYIVRKAGMSIPEIFASSGEERFRSLESSCLLEILSPDHGPASANPQDSFSPNAGVSTTAADLVLSLGGGTILRAENAALIAAHCRCIFLRTSLETVRHRLEGESAGRPMLQRSDIGELFASRAAAYATAADIIIDTDSLSPSEIARKIIGRYQVL